MVDERKVGASRARAQVHRAHLLVSTMLASVALAACSDDDTTGADEQAQVGVPTVSTPAAPMPAPSTGAMGAPGQQPVGTPGTGDPGVAGGGAPPPAMMQPPEPPTLPPGTMDPSAPMDDTPIDLVDDTPDDPVVVLDGDPVPSAGCGQGASPGSGDYSLDVNGTQRTYIVAVPSGYDENRPYRLVFAWHYLGGSASGIARGGYYGLESRSQGSAIFVSAEGIDAGWSNSGGRDVAFASAMIDWMKSNYCIDEARIFSTGFSYGGIMSNTVGCALGDQFRAIAPMAGSGPRAFGGASCTGQVAAWLAHGNSDTVVSFSSGQGSRDHWVSSNGCGATTSPMGDCVAYEGCDAGYPVHWCEYSGGHTQPRFGPDAIWAFFEQF